MCWLSVEMLWYSSPLSHFILGHCTSGPFHVCLCAIALLSLPLHFCLWFVELIVLKLNDLVKIFANIFCFDCVFSCRFVSISAVEILSVFGSKDCLSNEEILLYGWVCEKIYFKFDNFVDLLVVSAFKFYYCNHMSTTSLWIFSFHLIALHT